MASLANTVPVGGYDCEFVEPPTSAFQVDCAVCLLKLRDPQQVSCCGKNFCDSCIKGLQQCPTCNSSFTTFTNKGLKQSLTQLHVYCTHRSDGCEWTGELGKLDQHLNENYAPGSEGHGCPYVEIRCIHCNERFQRQIHPFESCPKRQVRCQYYNHGCRWKGKIGGNSRVIVTASVLKYIVQGDLVKILHLECKQDCCTASVFWQSNQLWYFGVADYCSSLC